MLRLCFYHPRVTYMKWKNLDVTRVTSGRSWPLATSARRQSRCLLYPESGHSRRAKHYGCFRSGRSTSL